MFLKNTFLLLLIGALGFCSRSPEELIILGNEAIGEEKKDDALVYYTLAYHRSLDDQYSLDSFEEDQYTDAAMSSSGNALIALIHNEVKKNTSVSFYNFTTEQSWDKKIRGFIKYMTLSSNGLYAVWLVEKETDKCYIELWDISAEEKLPFTAVTNCHQKPAVSDTGQVLFILEKKIASFNTHSKHLQKDFIKQTPDAPLKGLPAWAWFQYSPLNEPFLTFGSAGVYKAYSLTSQKLSLLTRDAAAGQMYFLKNSNEVGVIVGGANNHKIQLFSTYPETRSTHTYPVRFWRDIAFFNRTQYYFVEDSKAFFHDGTEDHALPFFATKIWINTNQELIIFQKSGRFYRYNGNQPSALTFKIFQLISDIKE